MNTVAGIDSQRHFESSTEVAIPSTPPVRGRSIAFVTAVLLLLAILAAAFGLWHRHHEKQTLVMEQRETSLPTVQLKMPELSSSAQEIVLPGNMQAFVNAPIYARTNGYVRAWYKDIGSHVHKGELLATIETPELDEQLAQARADLATAKAETGLARITAERYRDLIGTKAVSQQDTDNAATALDANLTRVTSAEANVRRLEQLQAFEKVYAPFDGVITSRNTDTGQLIGANGGTSTGPQIGADTNTGSDRALFDISDISRLRIYVRVPQAYSPSARQGVQATLTLPQFPSRQFTGLLERTSDAFDPSTKTLLVEVDVRNPTGELLPGAYTEVHLKTANPMPAKVIPVSALVFRAEGLTVATMDTHHRAHLVHVVPGRDFGKTIEILSGLRDNEPVISNPPDSILDGEEVRPVSPETGSQDEARTGGGKR